jgi:iron complex transport system ATP-binding protein
MSAVGARDVHYAVRGTPILRGVSIDVEFGELVVLAGPNGAGKSTTLGVLAGDIVPDRGSVTLGDTPLAETPVPERARLRSVLLQQGSPTFAYRVREIVAMGREPWRRSTPAPRSTRQVVDDVQIVNDAMVRTATGHLADQDVTTLSGGEFQRVSVSRVLAQQCQVVFLDEPTDALDIAHQENVMRLARGLADSGHAVLAVLHDLELAAAYATRVVLVDGGRVVAEGTPEGVFTADRLSAVYAHPIEVLRHPRSGNLLITPVRVGIRTGRVTLDE